MNLITRQNLANQAANRWEKEVYGYIWSQLDSRDYNPKKAIFNKLVSLGEYPAPDAVDKVVGNDSWTRTFCNECEEENIDVVELGEEENYGSSTAKICESCLRRALELLYDQ